MCIGMLAALGVGFFGGTIGLWTLFKGIPETATKLKWLPSFASGVAMAAPLAVVPILCSKEKVKWAPKIAMLPGIIGGTFWNIANLTSLFAIDVLGYDVAYPIMQAVLVVAALWGVLLFKELKGCRVLS